MTPFDSSQAPLIRAVLVQGVRDTAFILVAHHSIADGLSLAYTIRDTLSALCGEPLEPLAFVPALEEILDANDETAALAQTDGLADAPAGQPSRFRPFGGARPEVKGLRLSAALTANLRERARQEGTTVHGALCGALVIAGREAFPNWREGALRIVSPINIRSLLDADENCGLFISAAVSNICGEAGAFWELARNAKAGIVGETTRDNVAALLRTIGKTIGQGADMATAADFLASAFGQEAAVTNLGELPFESQFGSLKLEPICGPAAVIGFEGAQTIGAAAVMDRFVLLTPATRRRRNFWSRCKVF